MYRKIKMEPELSDNFPQIFTKADGVMTKLSMRSSTEASKNRG